MRYSTKPKVLQDARAMLGEKLFTVGTLSYTKGALLLLFSWLMWNDLCLMLMENVAPELVPLMLKDHGASGRDIAFFTSTLTGFLTIWINPVVSTWSDRSRTRFGRRRPFLLFATPFCALCLAAIPFTPDLFEYLNHNPALTQFFAKHHALGVSTFIGIGLLFYQLFNSVIQAIFTYYFWDVVPEAVLGRFSALMKVTSNIANLFWNYFLFGRSEHHLKAVFVGVAAFFFVVYMVTVWRVKEGQYPPPSQDERPGLWAAILSFFRDCYRPYYLWFIIGNTLFQIGNKAGTFQTFYYLYTLNLSRNALGHIKSVPTILVILIGYPMGYLVDRFKPGRMMVISVLIYAVADVMGYEFLRGYWSLFTFMGAIAVIVCCMQISMSVFTVEFFPREKLGQFCSANTMMHSVIGMVAAPFIGGFFDWVKDYRYAFLWPATFYVLAAPLYLKAYLNWKKLKIVTGEPDSVWKEPADIEEIVA